MYLAANHPGLSLSYLQPHCKKGRHQELQTKKILEHHELSFSRRGVCLLCSRPFRQLVLQLTHPVKTALYRGADQDKQYQPTTTEQLSPFFFLSQCRMLTAASPSLSYSRREDR